MKMNEIERNFALGMLLNQIHDSEFDKLEVSKVDGGVCVAMAGQTYGIIGALGAALADLHKGLDMELDDLAVLVRMAADIALMGECKEDHKQFKSREEMLDFMKNFFEKGGK